MKKDYMKIARVFLSAALLIAMPAMAQTQRLGVISSDKQEQWKTMQERKHTAVVTTRAQADVKPLAPAPETLLDQPFKVENSSHQKHFIPTVSADYKMPAQVYGILAYSNKWPNGSGKGQYGVYTFTADKPGTSTAVVKDDLFAANGGAIFGEGKYNVLNYTAFWGTIILDYDYYQYDTYYWDQLKNVHAEDVTRLMSACGSYDPATGQYYAIMYTEDMKAQVFGTLDYGKNSRQIICQLDSANNILAMAISQAGVVYGIRIDGMLVQIDKTNGRMTEVGPTGVRPLYLQSAAIDPRTGRMFWAACSQLDPLGLYEVDLSTGKATLIGTFPNSEEYVGLFIPSPKAEEAAPAAPTTLSLTFLRDSLEGSARFRMPKLTFAGEEITAAEVGYRVYVAPKDDEGQVGEFTLASEGSGAPYAYVRDTFNVAERGLYRISVCAYNEAGESPRVWVDKFLGNDAPKAPGSVKLAKGDDGVVKLSWTAPTQGVHSGYVNASKMNYTIVRYPDEVVVAEHQAERTFEETLKPEKMQNYYYKVTAWNGDVEGLSAESNRLLLGEVIEPPYFEDFEDTKAGASMFTFVDANNDGNTWQYGFWNGTQNADIYYITNDDRTTPADDWAFTAPIHLQKGKFYNLTFDVNNDYYFGGTEIISAWIGADKTIAAMTTSIVPRTEVTNGDPAPLTGIIKSDADANYYIGFHVQSPADQSLLELDNIRLEEGGMFEAPDTVQNLKVVPADRGNLTVGIDFDVPTTDFYGNPITQVDSVVVYRGSSKRRLYENPEPGKSIHLNDTQVPNGNNTYYIYTYNSYGHGIPAQRTVWVGIDIPTEPLDLTLTMSGRQARLKWTAPTTGIHGGYVNPQQITYNIEDNHSYIKGQNRTGTTFSETITQTEQDYLYYRVSAQSSAGGGNYAYSNTVIVGTPYALPFNESFANAKTDKLWNQQATGGAIGLTDGVSVDDDGGCAIFKPDAVGQTGMITSGKINVSTAKHPLLEFYYYAIPRQTTTITIGVVPDGNADQLRAVQSIDYSKLTGQPGWRKVQVSLDEFASTNFIYIAFIGTSTGSTFGDIAFDAITVREHYDTDLSATINVPAYVITGGSMDVVAHVENIGRQATADYTVQLFKNGIFADEQNGVSVAAGKTADVVFKVPTLVTDEQDNVFEVRIICNADGDQTNNRASGDVVYEMPIYPAPAPVSASNVDDELTLNWQAPDLTARDVRITDDFDSYPSFIVDGMGRWTTLDVDGINTGVLSTGDGTPVRYANAGKPFAFQVFNPIALGLSTTQLGPHSGNQMLVNMTETPYAGNDWLFSPELNGKAQTISFWVRSVADGYIESFEVMASQTDMNPESFTKVASSTTQAPVAWTEVTAQLPEGTKYFAIHVANKQKFMLMIDDFSYVLFNTQDLKLLGYNLYWNGERINEELIPTNSFQGYWYGEGDYQVTAVYEQGESVLSEPFSISTDGIQAVDHSPLNIDRARIYNIGGQRLSKPRRGVNIVDGQKVVVK